MTKPSLRLLLLFNCLHSDFIRVFFIAILFLAVIFFVCEDETFQTHLNT